MHNFREGKKKSFRYSPELGIMSSLIPAAMQNHLTATVSPASWNGRSLVIFGPEKCLFHLQGHQYTAGNPKACGFSTDGVREAMYIPYTCIMFEQVQVLTT